MGDVYNIFSKKKVDQPRPTDFSQRYKQCLVRSSENGYCDCEICLDKIQMSNRLFDIVRYLCVDYKERTGKDLYVADALEVVLNVVVKLKTKVVKS